MDVKTGPVVYQGRYSIINSMIPFMKNPVINLKMKGKVENVLSLTCFIFNIKDFKVQYIKGYAIMYLFSTSLFSMTCGMLT